MAGATLARNPGLAPTAASTSRAGQQTKATGTLLRSPKRLVRRDNRRALVQGSAPGVAMASVAAAAGAAAVGGLSAAAAAATFSFTPAESLLGGLTLGVLAFSKLALTGKILGISGIVKGLVQGSAQAWRLAFVMGMVAGGFALQLLHPAAFEALPAAYTLQRAVLAGLLVGLGSAMSPGCTSGHGICGNSRLSVRSLVATLVFMAAGVLFAPLTGITAVFGLPRGIAPPTTTAAAAAGTHFGVVLLAATAAVMAVLGLAARALTGKAFAPTPAALQKELEGAEELEDSSLIAPPPPEPTSAQKLASLAVFSDLLVGFLFSLGLGVSGMARPSKVAAFLSVTAGTFDPSLMLVMGGAILVALPTFQAVLRFKAMKHPVCAPTFDLPAKQDIDLPLVLGSLIFGAGWGIGGVCPGPGLANFATLQPQVLAFVGAMLVGMTVEPYITRTLVRGGKK